MAANVMEIYGSKVFNEHVPVPCNQNHYSGCQ